MYLEEDPNGRDAGRAKEKLASIPVIVRLVKGCEVKAELDGLSLPRRYPFPQVGLQQRDYAADHLQSGESGGSAGEVRSGPRILKRALCISFK
jgi:hypothetical protein